MLPSMASVRGRASVSCWYACEVDGGGESGDAGGCMSMPWTRSAHFLTSIVGAATYAILSLTTSGDIAPDWLLGLLCGLGGLFGGYLGARLQPRMPKTALRLLLGALAVGLAVLYLAQAFS